VLVAEILGLVERRRARLRLRSALVAAFELDQFDQKHAGRRRRVQRAPPGPRAIARPVAALVGAAVVARQVDVDTASSLPPGSGPLLCRSVRATP
jgi:hypothetical protein